LASDATRMCELLVGLGEVRVLAVTDEASLVVTIETTAGRQCCRSWGLRAVVKDPPTVLLGDLA
jgi:hypothetical protein